MIIFENVSAIYRDKKNKAIIFFGLFLFFDSLVLVVAESLKIAALNPVIKTDFLYFVFWVVFISMPSLLFLQKDIFRKKALIFITLFFPTAIVIALGLFFSSGLHYSMLILVEAFFIICGLYLMITGAKKWETSVEEENKKDKGASFYKKSILFIVIFVVILNILFSSYKIENFAAVDEPLWLFGRIQSYWNGIQWHDWKMAQVSDKPGITVALISGVGLIFENPERFNPTVFKGFFYRQPGSIEPMLYAMRLPIALFASISLIFFYWIIKKIIGKLGAAISIVFIGLSPILIGISRIVNPDSLLWIFAPLSIFAYFAYLGNRQKKFLILSGIFLGLALLTKYVANILLVYFLAMIFLEYIFQASKYKNISIECYLKQSIFDYLSLIFVGLLTFFILCPACWFDPRVMVLATIKSQAFGPIAPVFLVLLGALFIDGYFLKAVISSSVINFLEKREKTLFIASLTFFLASIIFVFGNVLSGMKMFDIEKILISPKLPSNLRVSWISLQIFFSNYYPLIFGISPIALLAIMLKLFKMIFWEKKEIYSKNNAIVLFLILFIFLYYAGSVFNDVASTIRYQIILYPIFFTVAAISLADLMALVCKHLSIKLSLLLLLILFCCVSLYNVFPFYSGYASAFLPKKYYLDLKDMGAGSYEAAEYLNSFPNAEQMNVWTDKAGLCYFFKGNCYLSFYPKDLEGIEFSFAVLSSGREKRSSTMASRLRKYPEINFPKYYDDDGSTVKKIIIDNRPNQYVKIVKINSN